MTMTISETRKLLREIPDKPILQFLEKQVDEKYGGFKWSTWGNGFLMPTVQDAMPPGTSEHAQRIKMHMLGRRGLVQGCFCGCRGDYEITTKGLEELYGKPLVYVNGQLDPSLCGPWPDEP